MLPDIDRVSAIIREAAEADILPRFQRLQRHEVHEKGAGELVTVADIEAERRITDALTKLAPGSVVLGEEAAARNPGLVDSIRGKDRVWLVDPVDGTGNFAAGDARFAVIVCYLADGEAKVGWIHDPVGNSTAIAEAGEGAWYQGERLKSAPAVAIEHMIGLLNHSYFPPERRESIRRRARKFAQLHSARCAAHDYLSLARGKKHFSLYRRLWPWDHAAGVLLLAEAGGYTARLDHSEYHAWERVPGILSAGDRPTWEQVEQFLHAP